MPEGQNRFREWLSLVADLWSLIPESIRGYIPTGVGFMVTWILNRLGVPPLEAFGVGVCIAILLALPVVLRYMSRPSPTESAPSAGETSALRTRASALRIKLGASQIVGLFVVASLIYSLYLQSQLREIQKDIRCVVLPRHLTFGQQAEVAARLKKHKSYEITLKIPVLDGEVARYASEFERAFTEGKWRVKREFPPLLTDNTFPKQDVELIYLVNPKTLGKYNEWHDPDHPHPGQVAIDAFKDLGIGYSAGGDDDEKIKEDVYEISLTIGVRPYSQCE